MSATIVTTAGLVYHGDIETTEMPLPGRIAINLSNKKRQVVLDEKDIESIRHHHAVEEGIRLVPLTLKEIQKLGAPKWLVERYERGAGL